MKALLVYEHLNYDALSPLYLCCYIIASFLQNEYIYICMK